MVCSNPVPGKLTEVATPGGLEHRPHATVMAITEIIQARVVLQRSDETAANLLDFSISLQ
jgi:hypothetical protein